MSMPGREPAPSTPLCAALATGVDGQARRVVVGLNWTFVEGPAGAGLAHTPARGTAGCLALPADRSTVVYGTSVSVRVDLGGRCIITTQPIYRDRSHNSTT